MPIIWLTIGAVPPRSLGFSATATELRRASILVSLSTVKARVSTFDFQSSVKMSGGGQSELPLTFSGVFSSYRQLWNCSAAHFLPLPSLSQETMGEPMVLPEPGHDQPGIVFIWQVPSAMWLIEPGLVPFHWSAGMSELRHTCLPLQVDICTLGALRQVLQSVELFFISTSIVPEPPHKVPASGETTRLDGVGDPAGDGARDVQDAEDLVDDHLRDVVDELDRVVGQILAGAVLDRQPFDRQRPGDGDQAARRRSSSDTRRRCRCDRPRRRRGSASPAPPRARSPTAPSSPP